MHEPAPLCSHCGQPRLHTPNGCTCIPTEFWALAPVAAAVAEGDAASVIREIRARLSDRLSQNALALMTELSQSTISRVSLGATLQDPRKAAQALRGLGAPTPQRARVRAEALPAPTDPTAPAALSDVLTDSTDIAEIDALKLRLSSCAHAYVSEPFSTPLKVAPLRNHALDLLRQGARPGHEAQLLEIVGTAELMLGHAAHDSGHRHRATQHLANAADCARHGDHPSLASWTAGTEALVADWRPTEHALDLALAAERLPHGPQARTRLRAIRARAAARRGQHHRARAELEQLLTASAHQGPEHPGDLSMQVGGILSFPEAKLHYYAASIHGLLGEADQALEHAGQAIALYEHGPAGQRSVGDLTLAMADRIRAHLLRGDAPSALEAIARLSEVADTCPTHIHQLKTVLTHCSDTITASPVTSAEAREIADSLAVLRVRWNP